MIDALVFAAVVSTVIACACAWLDEFAGSTFALAVAVLFLYLAVGLAL